MTTEVSSPQAIGAFSGPGGQKRMIDIADEMKAMIAEKEKQGEKWLIPMGNSKHATIEAWQYLGQRVGLAGRTEGYQELRNPHTGEFEGYSAAATVERMDTGATIGRAEQVCFADEVVKRQNDGTIFERWLDEEGKPNRHAILGMAQTRAQSRAFASVIRFLMEMAGVSGTPAEEMDGTRPAGEATKKRPQRKKKTETEGERKERKQGDAKKGDIIVEALPIRTEKKTKGSKTWYEWIIQKVGSTDEFKCSTFSEEDTDIASSCAKNEEVCEITLRSNKQFWNVISIFPKVKEDPPPPE